MTTKQLAEHLGISPRTVIQYHYVHGHCNGYTPDNIGMYSKFNPYVWSKK